MTLDQMMEQQRRAAAEARVEVVQREEDTSKGAEVLKGAEEVFSKNENILHFEEEYGNNFQTGENALEEGENALEEADDEVQESRAEEDDKKQNELQEKSDEGESVDGDENRSSVGSEEGNKSSVASEEGEVRLEGDEEMADDESSDGSVHVM